MFNFYNFLCDRYHFCLLFKAAAPHYYHEMDKPLSPKENKRKSQLKFVDFFDENGQNMTFV